MSVTLDAFAPIDLAGLNESAELLTRRDRKYLLPTTLLGSLLASLPPTTRALEIAGLRQFRYQSHYFDTSGLDCYLAAARGRRRRFKSRTRTYLDSGDTYLEVKIRGGRGITVKQRLAYDGEAALDAAPGRWFIDQALSASGTPSPSGALTHSLTCHCLRLTLALPDGEGRLTLDTHLRWDTPGGVRLTVDDLVIAETKTAGPPCPADRALWALGVRPVRFSKYATALAAAHGSLPANRWHRSLATVFDARSVTPSHAPPASVPRVSITHAVPSVGRRRDLRH